MEMKRMDTNEIEKEELDKGIDKILQDVEKEGFENNGLSEDRVHSDKQAYSPDHTYVVDGESKRFDEVFSDQITSKEAEDRLRDLYSNSVDNENLKNQVAQYEESLGKLQALKDQDVGELLRVLDVSEDQVLEYALKIASHRELPPERQEEIRNQEKLRRENEALNSRISEMEEFSQNADKDRFVYSFEQELARPDVQQFAQRYNSLVGNEDAFKNEVIQYGAAKNSPTPQQAINAVIKKYSFIDKMSTPTQPPSGEEKPYIPNVSGNVAHSPVRKRFKSLDEIRNHANNL